MTQQINEITKVPSNATVIKILNQIIKRYNSLGDLYQYKGSVQTYDDLLAIQNPQIGDVYNVIQEDAEQGIAAGSNFAWNGTEWDNLGMGMDGLVKKINGFIPDDLGSVIFKYIKSIEDEDGTLNIIAREGESETQLTIQTGKVKTVNGINPDSLGNVLLPLIKNITTNQGAITFTKNDDTTIQVDNIKKLYPATLGEGVDLNTLTESGVYFSRSNAEVANYLNCPIKKAFFLEVQTASEGNFVYQFLTQYNDSTVDAGNQYTRAYYNGNWSAWSAVNDTDLSGYAQLKSANTFTALNVFRANIAVSSGTTAGSQGQIIIGNKPQSATVQANIISSTTGALNYIATENAGHYFRIGNNTASTSITTNDSETAILSHNAFEFARITNVGVAKWLGNANTATKLETSRTINGVAFDGTKDITIDIPKPVIASEAEAKAGADNTKFMTPLRVKQAISVLAGNSSWTISQGAKGWARENSTGLTVQWGYMNRTSGETFIFPRTFAICYYSNVMCSSNLVPYITARSNTSITFNTNNGYNDDIQNWGNCYIFAIGIS